MKTRIVHLLPLVMMVLLAVLTLWLEYTVQDRSIVGARPAKHEPDVIIEDFVIQRLDESGRLRYTFSAPKMVHFPDDGSGEVLYPRIVQVADDGGNFTATANRGVVNRLGEEAFLYGNVEVLREATPQNPEFRVSTEFLHVLAEQGISRTDRTVTINDGRSTLTGVGMVVNEKKRQFSLSSQVRGTFNVPGRK